MKLINSPIMYFLMVLLYSSFSFAQALPNGYSPGQSNSITKTTAGTFNSIPVNNPAAQNKPTTSQPTPPTNKTDAAITSEVQTLITQDPLLLKSSINAVTQQGVVTLTGEADSQVAAERAVKIAKSIFDVKLVTSKITVKNTSPNK